jgi:hypothetical protein
MRHTFISMFVAKFRPIGEAAIQAGNSEGIIRRHYLDPKNADEAEACCIRFCGDERLSKRSHHAGKALATSVFTGSFSWRKEMRPTEAG